MVVNKYMPFLSEIKEVIKHTDIEYTFRMAYNGPAMPGQFFEVSMPKVGEAPISISGISKEEGLVDLTIRRVGRVTAMVFEHLEGQSLFLRGPYGIGFNLDDYKGKELVIIAGGTGVSPVRGVIDYFANHPDEVKSMTVIAGFKSSHDILFRKDFERWEKVPNVKVIMTLDKPEEGYKDGLVTAYIPKLQLQDVKSAVAITVGPPPMMRFSIQGLLAIGFQEENIWLSYERRMSCGLGKCGHCRINDVYVCLRGPVFNYAKTKHLMD